MSTEEPLSGGNTTRVVRVGDTVRRSAGHWTPAVHALLDHLAASGFDGAPRVLGVDDQGREILQFVPGDVGTLSPEEPLSPWFGTPEACRAVGAWIREFQRAQRGFTPHADHPWRRAPGGPLPDGQVLVHHDVSPYNAVRRPDGGLTIIDWDFVRPGHRLQDLAWAAWRWVPLMAGERWQAEYGVTGEYGVDDARRARFAALVEGFGASAADRAALPDAISAEITSHARDLETLAERDPAFAGLIDRGYADDARADAKWWAENADLLLP